MSLSPGHASFERISSRPVDWVIGPYHSALPGPMRLAMKLDGEVISSAAVEAGYARRGIEKLVSTLNWAQVIPVVDRLDPEAAVFGEWVYCLALEKALGISISDRARAIRILLAELSRISAHLHYLSSIALATGSEMVFHFMLRERENILDLNELVSGSRHSPAFFRVGGVRDDVTEGFLERLLEVCQRVLDRLAEYNDLLTYNEAFVRRVAARGTISSEMVRRHGLSGIPARVFDATADLRWTGALGYDLVQHQKATVGPPVGVAGDIHHRFVFRLHEIRQSAQLLQELAKHIPAGECRVRGEFTRVPAGRHVAAVEAPRGRLEIEVLSDGGLKPQAVRFKTPSEALLSAISSFLSGAPIEDLALYLTSLDLQIGEVDR